MMNVSWGVGFALLGGLHMLFALSFLIGVLFLLFWSFKHLSEKQLKTWGWTLLIAGAVGCLLTIGAMGHPRMGGHGMTGGFGAQRMMWEKVSSASPEDDAAQAKEEAEGRALYDKLAAKEAACADLSDADFELVGEYVMGRKLETSHVSMNERMKFMMGDRGEEQMHVTLGKNSTGCGTGTPSDDWFGGMMDPGMMRQFQSGDSR